MAPNNFDKNIKDKFNNRKIEPSAQAWDRLDAMLTVAEEKKQPKTFFWLKIAATFLLFSGMGYIFFQQNQKPEIVSPANEVVITNEKSDSDNNNTSIENNSEISNAELNQNTPITEKELAIVTPKTTYSKTEKATKQNENTTYKSKLDTYIAATTKQNEILKQNENNQKPTYNYITPESLLADVQGNKKTNGTTNTYKSTVKVNPNDLLNSVESELDQSFKDKTLAKFKQVKSVVVNRNYN